MNVKANASSQKTGSSQGKPIDLSDSLLNKGNNKSASNMENRNEIKAIITDSLRNCPINWLRTDPTVLRMPTSLALFSLRAVERFIKLMQARRITNTPIIEKSQINCMRPPEDFPLLKSLYN